MRSIRCYVEGSGAVCHIGQDLKQSGRTTASQMASQGVSSMVDCLVFKMIRQGKQFLPVGIVIKEIMENYLHGLKGLPNTISHNYNIKSGNFQFLAKEF